MMLFVGHVLPFPENTGTKIRLANLLRAACEAGPVQFVGYWDDGPPEDPENIQGIAALKALSPNAVILKRDSPWWPDLQRDDTAWALEHYVRRPGAFVFREYACASLIREVARLARGADLIWVERLWMAEHLGEFADRIIVDIDDLESIKLKRKMQSWRLTLPVLAAWYDCWKTARTERAAARKYLRSIICSEGDLAFWGKLTSRTAERLWVIPNGFNDELLTLPLPEVDVPRVIFVGTLKYWPNAEAVIMFVRNILPRLLARHPALEFWIVGRSPVDEVLALDNGGSVRVFADVPDVIDYVRQAAVSVVPLRVGGGTRLKILESIGAGVPVVSTPVGIEGIDLEPETHFLQAVTSTDFANQVSRLIEDPQLRKQQVLSARKEIARRYGWAAIRSDVTAKLLALRGSFASTSSVS